MDFECGDAGAWRAALGAYAARVETLAGAAASKRELLPLDSFYRGDLPLLLRRRGPKPFLSKSELLRVVQWKLSRGQWRPRLMGYAEALGEAEVEAASRAAFAAIPDLARAVSELTALKGVGPATASAILAAFAPEIAPFMSDEAMMVAMGNKEYTLKHYLAFAEKLQKKAKELSVDGESFTPTDIERALWSSVVGSKALSSSEKDVPKADAKRSSKRKRKP
ncbi:uncharacterized protein LOC109721803 [Ananas comosus]|uniref:Uncharacterized protein LOC109721803 n=1 Tax=Ananas comosus TaxID=4615 RepID=A0A6P5GAG0_ANACO|nr:uncharacterized protein LOC109721803 [Ananas comosus]